MALRILVGFIAVIAVIGIVAITGLAVLYGNARLLPAYWRGQAAKSGELVYVVLGDSAAVGVGALDPDRSYAGRLAGAISNETGRKVRVINLAVSGATIHDVLVHQVPQLEQLAGNDTTRPYLVTLDAGANDVTHGNQARPAFRRDYEQVLQALPPGRSVIGNLPYFGGRIRADQAVQQANGIIEGLAGRYRLPVADLYGQLKPRQSPWIYAADLFHPNARGYAIWYDAYWQQLQPVITKLPAGPPPSGGRPLPLPAAGH